ncbi:hypothetical protein A9Q73_03950 [Bermanella sp. 47_1433_sub80_T6]|nr:hypothetical protein A9Q73_03950 [Bermanella sp. 47_1433_sub80_T6]
MLHIKTLSLVCSLILTLICLPVNAASLAAHVILSKGVATATTLEGEVRPLKRRSKVFSGDIINTGPKGSVQLRFVDKALMTIKASTQMDITNYLFKQDATTGKEQVLMKLVKGGFRTITGSIGKGDKEAYKVSTPAASIGIRGTNYEVQQESGGAFVMAVYSGGISVANDAGTIDLGLGADFNFTRVSADAAPQGLLEAPESLSVNAATDESQDEEQEEAGDSETAAAGEEGEEDGEDSGDESAAADSGEGDSEGGDDAPVTESQEALVGLDEGTTEAEVDILTALDQQLTEELIENIDEKAAEEIEKYIASGDLEAGETLADLADGIKDFLGLGNDAEDVIDNTGDDGVFVDPTIEPEPEPEPVVDPNPLGLFEFENAYVGLNNQATDIPDAIISSDEFNLATSEKLAMLVIPLDYSISAAKRPTFSSLEPQLSSPIAIDPNTFSAFDFSASGNETAVSLYYELLDTTSNTTTHYELNLVINNNISTVTDLEAAIAAAIPLADVYVEGTPLPPGSPIHVQFNLITDPGTGESRFEFKPNSGTDEFITEMGLNFAEDGSPAELMLLSQLGSGANVQDDWRARVETDLVVAIGSWDTASNTPIFISTEQEEKDGQVFDSTQIIYKEANATQTVSSLAALALCGDSGIICDIQKDNVAAAINIRWGAWLAEPAIPGDPNNTGEPITIHEISEDELGFLDTLTHQEETTLAFWIAAERADINTLTGTASFASAGLTDCSDYGQCIGFADDGGVKKVTGQFNVNFNNGAISNGLLRVETAGSDITKPDAQILSDWQVNFSGQLSNNTDGTMAPEFQTTNVNGTIQDGAGNAISNKVIGSVGGIFVKPGTVFAGGYNLSTADESNKHTAGVFSLQKNP